MLSMSLFSCPKDRIHVFVYIGIDITTSCTMATDDRGIALVYMLISSASSL